NNWSYTWTDLAVNASGEAVVYTVAEVSVPEGYEETTKLVDGVVVITNTYKPSEPSEPSVTINLQAHKELEGRKLKDNEFKFVVVQDGNVIGTANNAADGSVQFNSIRFTEVGTYEYTIRELQGNDDEVTYDNSEYKVTVEVVSEGEELIANITYHTPNGDIPVFVNTVDADESEEPGTPSKPGSNLPATGEESFMWFGVVTLVIGISFLLSVKFKRNKE
nr:FctA domain-containing protein [Globicatella sanguinis]